jgi:hypothetical protein
MKMSPKNLMIFHEKQNKQYQRLDLNAIINNVKHYHKGA